MKEKIESNKKLFLDTNIKYGNFITQGLLDFLGEGLFIGPSAQSNQYPYCFPGGLISNILNVTEYAFKINNILPTKLKVDKNSLIKICFLHQIGKTFLFELNTVDWEIKRGNLYKFNENLSAIQVGERSLSYSLKHGVELSDNEIEAILNWNKSDEDKQSKYHSSMETIILKQAIELSNSDGKL